MVRGACDSGYDRLGLGLADGAAGAAGSAPVPAARPDEDGPAPGCPPPSEEAHTATPVPSAIVPTTAAATAARLDMSCRAGLRRLWLC
ncbi:hypothetical protein ACE1SV_40030 [Streptomyces sp. E-15]